MNKKNWLLGLIAVAIVALGIVLLVPRDSGNPASADNRDCNKGYGYNTGRQNRCSRGPRPLLYRMLNIGTDED